MRTEDDLRQAIDVEPDVRAVDRLMGFAADLERGRPAPAGTGNPRRRTLPLLAAAAVVLVAGVAVGLAQLQHHSHDRVAGGDDERARRPTWNLRIGHVPGYRVTRVSASSIGLATGSLFDVRATSATRPERGTLTTCPGRSLAACVDTTGAQLRHVTVNGRPGVFTEGGRVSRGSLSESEYHRHPWRAANGSDRARPELSWFAGHDTVVYLYGSFGFDPATHRYDNALARRVLLRLAAAVSAGRHDPAYLPFALRGLPDRVAPESVVLGLGACSDYGTGPVSENDALGTVFTACRERTGATRADTIRAADTVSPDETGQITGSRPDAIVVHDFPDSTSIVISIVRGKDTIVSRALAERLATNADVSPRLTDRSTWLEVG